MYKIIKSRKLQELEESISGHLAKGYLLAGGLQTIYHQDVEIDSSQYIRVDFHSTTYMQQVTFAQAVYLPQTKEPPCLT